MNIKNNIIKIIKLIEFKIMQISWALLAIIVDAIFVPFYKIKCLVFREKSVFPPRRLIYIISGFRSIFLYVKVGKKIFEQMTSMLIKNNIDEAKFEKILDFGCGCGRVIRYFDTFGNKKIFGTDYDQAAITWCQRNLTFASFSINNLYPPLNYQDEEFDFIYAISVFTHFPESLRIVAG